MIVYDCYWHIAQKAQSDYRNKAVIKKLLLLLLLGWLDGSSLKAVLAQNWLYHAYSD